MRPTERDALTSHVAKKDVVYLILKRVMNIWVAITGALITLLLSIIGYPVTRNRLSGAGQVSGLLIPDHRCFAP